jgi:FkbM family methyltransferase
MLIKKIFNYLSKFHYNSIYSYSKNLNFEIMIDIGSHQGEFISRFLHYKKIKNFFCFEPNKMLFKKLSNRYKLNKKISLFDYALGDNNSNKKLFLSNLSYNSTMSSFNTGSNYLKLKNFILKDQKNKKFITIKQKMFDHIFKNKNIKNSFLKIDVEGYEYNVLKGASKKIKDAKYILIENQFSNQYKNNFDKVKKLLIKYNFTMIKSFYYPTLHYRDILFINKRYKKSKN